MSKGVKFGRKPKLSDYQRQEALKRRAAGETLAEIAKATPSSELIRELPRAGLFGVIAARAPHW
jgi:hypothetical protein